jgi:hypothetical protein
MERPRTLVVHYSLGGNTRRLARAIAEALGADVEEIRERVDRRGIVGYLRCGIEVLLEASVEIERPKRDPADYDLVVVGSPVWVSSVSTPVRTYLWLERERLPAVAFFVTLGGMGSDRAFGLMREIAGKAPVATLAVREAELAGGVPHARVAAFVKRLGGSVRRGARRRKLRAAS